MTTLPQLSLGCSEWTQNYVGIPYISGGRDRSGLDCYGLLRLVYAEILGIDLPSFTESYLPTTERHELARILQEYRVRGSRAWMHLLPRRARPLDATLFRVAGEACHIGIYLGQNRILHTRPHTGSCIQRIDRVPWDRRLEGFYRCHQSM